jgi:hypothetical protein
MTHNKEVAGHSVYSKFECKLEADTDLATLVVQL